MAEPLREPTFLLLTGLAAGRLHGYGMITEVGRISDGRVRLRAGTSAGGDLLAAEAARMTTQAAEATERLKASAVRVRPAQARA